LKNKEDQHAQILYDYHRFEQPLIKADAIFVLGSHDPSVADYAVQLYQEGYSKKIIFSGGVVRIHELRNAEPKTEAEAFADIAISKGVTAEDIIQEKLAMNTGDNFIKTMELLKSQNLDYQSFILVQKPYMLRRTYATAMVQIPDKQFVTSAMPDTYESYVSRCESNGISMKRVIDNMVGDLQRLIEYPAQGFLAKMELPKEVLDAYNELVKMGFIDRMIGNR
jgi:uncharacterized SAM-binding protein YcdF (DUF218 family)